MKKTTTRLAVIRADEIDETTDRNDSGSEGIASTLVDMGKLNWQATQIVLGGQKMLPRDFEVTLVPGPEDLQ